MAKRSSVSPGIIIKNLGMLGQSPWIVSKLVRLQMAKQFFSLATPQAHLGLGRRIHQLSIRITDVCNLRCHTCGQWGDSGFLCGANLKELKKAEVSPQRYQELMRDLVAHGHKPNVYIWGGEPMLYPRHPGRHRGGHPAGPARLHREQRAHAGPGGRPPGRRALVPDADLHRRPRRGHPQRGPAQRGQGQRLRRRGQRPWRPWAAPGATATASCRCWPRSP